MAGEGANAQVRDAKAAGMSSTGQWNLTGRLVALSLVFAAALSGVSMYAAADNTQIPSNNIYLVDKTGVSAGTVLKWDWSTPSTVIFSISGASNPTDVLYRKEGTSDSGELAVPKDDTYLLSWFNPSISSIELTFSVSVGPSAGSIVLVILLLIPFIAALTFVVLYVRRKGGLAPQRMPPSSEMRGTPPMRPPAVPPPAPPPPPGYDTAPVRRGVGYCPNCGSTVAREAVFCGNCGSRLNPG